MPSSEFQNSKPRRKRHSGGVCNISTVRSGGAKEFEGVPETLFIALCTKT